MEPFLGEIRIASFPTVPRGWARCDGQLMPINQNQALAYLLGMRRFGGNGTTTYALPDLRGRMPMHRATANELAVATGEAAHTLTEAEMPAHNHLVNATAGTGTSDTPMGHRPAGSRVDGTYTTASPDTAMSATLTTTGGNLPHENRSPYLGMNFIIALSGFFPSRQ